MNRRQSLKLLSSMPLLAAMPSVALGEAKPAAKGKADGKMKMISEQDTLPKAMKYVADVKNAPPMRTNKKAFCWNCAKYNKCMTGDKACKEIPKKDLAKATAAPCQIFKGGNVAKDGWCLSWQANA
ncbi:MAG: high-potential iron-sulfur protein [Pseudomonadota bacterium]